MAMWHGRLVYIPTGDHFIRRKEREVRCENSMRIVIFGLTVSSSWGNGHATLWRSLIKSLLRRGHQVTFYERDAPYYARTRDLHEFGAGGKLCLYANFEEIGRAARLDLDVADLAICTSYCADGIVASKLILESQAGIKCFYDLDTPVTLDALARSQTVNYLPPAGLAPFDLVLSYTGGRALDELKTKLGARFVAPLYGSVDPEMHHPVARREDLDCTLSYLGTHAADRQPALELLFLSPATSQPSHRFLLCGSQYPHTIRWPENVMIVEHMRPHDHAAFFSSSRATLNITRRAMADYGYCPSGRLFEAAACETCILSDWWEGLDSFFIPGEEILIVRSAEDVLSAIQQEGGALRRIGAAARVRALADHTGDSRIVELERICKSVLAASRITSIV